MKVLIVTEGGRSIGFGHITRCTSIYQAFEEIGVLPEFVVNCDETVGDLLKDKNCEVFEWLKDQEKLLGMVSDADLVFVDSYLADYGLYEEVSRSAKKAVYFDDNLRLDYPKGFVLNGAVLAEQMPYPKREGVTYLLGVRYMPLRKEFWQVPEKPIRDNIGTVMITFGAAALHNLTPKILKLLNNTYPKLLKKVIIAKSLPNIAEIEQLRENHTELIYHPDAGEMKKVMLECDIAISACGQTLYELARVGTPTIGVCIVQNQMQNVEGWTKVDFLEYVGWHDDENLFDKIMKAITKLMPFEDRVKRSQAGINHIDGKGAKRIIASLTKTAPVV